mgnify:CR=1 FL=1
MLQKLRDQTQGTGFRVITVLLIFALVVGLGAANFFASTSSDVAEVGGQGISEFDLSRQTERERRRILSQLGEDFNPNDLDRNQIQQFALSRLINGALKIFSSAKVMPEIKNINKKYQINKLLPCFIFFKIVFFFNLYRAIAF